MKNEFDFDEIKDIRDDFWFPKTILDRCANNNNHGNILKRITDAFEIFEKGTEKK